MRKVPRGITVKFSRIIQYFELRQKLLQCKIP